MSDVHPSEAEGRTPTPDDQLDELREYAIDHMRGYGMESRLAIGFLTFDALLAARSPAPSDDTLGADVLASRREIPQLARGVTSATQPVVAAGERVGASASVDDSLNAPRCGSRLAGCFATEGNTRGVNRDENSYSAAPSVEARDADREAIAQTLWIGFGLHVEKLGFHNDPESALRAASLIAQYAALLPPETP